MSESKAVIPNWSSLNTVKSIDQGMMGKDIIPANGDLYKSSAKSLFVESLVDQLCKLLEKDPHKRRKIYEGICAKLFEMKLVDETYSLKELASLRNHYQQAMINLLRASESSIFKTPSNMEWSRYFSEYEEEGFIAAGGFGKVYRAKHHLDQVFYAVKKIPVKFQNISVLVMESNEVKTLAKLNHPNIVQYKAAWLEPLYSVPPPLPNVDIPRVSSDSDEIIFCDSNSSGSNNESISSSVHTENENHLALCKYKKNDLLQNQHKTASQVIAVLYVSMQLCDETLREWLNKRNVSNELIDIPLCINIMIEATKGVEYIHSCNIVHHDIKPSNIFVSNNLKSVQVGDFGLSCCLQGLNHSGCPLEGGRFGTPLYAAPEQHKRQCNLKSDMFSLGIVFIELVSIFATEMERVSVLTKSRSGDVPPTVPKQLVPIIKKLISPKAEERPSSSQLLKMLSKLVTKPSGIKPSLSITKTQLISFNEKNQVDSASQTRNHTIFSSKHEFDEMIEIKDREIVLLRTMLANREAEIAQLKKYITTNCY